VADSKRRVPQQARARDTLEVIFEATARILLREGAGALNTNYIADRAGISVGTLYGYFPNKVAILLAMARREITRVTAAVVRAISSADPARLAIRALITEFSRHRKARRISFQTLVAEGFRAELEANMDEIAGALAARTERIIPGRREPIPAVSAFVLTRAVNGVLVSAANERSPHMGTAEFEDELVRLVRGFLNALPASP
jgi:AcrR family transcriptional regulator